ncbi:MAG: dTMP kinase, partial [Pseudomonadota bacterium]|nr:dTMP kinase [Pseudomonadota bacterium]
GRHVVQTREPGGTPLAEAIRGVVLQSWDEGVSPETELLLMFAARAAHVRHLIEPALASGRDVICDRFVDSSYAYQGAGKGVETHHVRALEALVLSTLKPDLTLILDLDPAQGLQRALARGQANRFEAEALPFMQRVRAAFLQRANDEPARCIVIDAAQAVDVVFEQIRRVLEARL